MKIKHIERNNFYSGEGYEYIFQIFSRNKLSNTKLASDLKRYILNELSKNLYTYRKKKVFTALHSTQDDMFHEDLDELFLEIDRKIDYTEEEIFEGFFLYTASLTLSDLDPAEYFK